MITHVRHHREYSHKQHCEYAGDLFHTDELVCGDAW